jgi:hypothetical protein
MILRRHDRRRRRIVIPARVLARRIGTTGSPRDALRSGTLAYVMGYPIAGFANNREDIARAELTST